jgi:hypothetical protein
VNKEQGSQRRVPAYLGKDLGKRQNLKGQEIKRRRHEEPHGHHLVPATGEWQGVLARRSPLQVEELGLA